MQVPGTEEPLMSMTAKVMQYIAEVEDKNPVKARCVFHSAAPMVLAGLSALDPEDDQGRCEGGTKFGGDVN